MGSCWPQQFLASEVIKVADRAIGLALHSSHRALDCLTLLYVLKMFAHYLFDFMSEPHDRVNVGLYETICSRSTSTRMRQQLRLKWRDIISPLPGPSNQCVEIGVKDHHRLTYHCVAPTSHDIIDGPSRFANRLFLRQSSDSFLLLSSPYPRFDPLCGREYEGESADSDSRPSSRIGHGISYDSIELPSSHGVMASSHGLPRPFQVSPSLLIRSDAYHASPRPSTTGSLPPSANSAW